MHEVLVNRLGGLSLPRKSVVRLTDRPDMTLDVYRGRKTTKQQQTNNLFKQGTYTLYNPKDFSPSDLLSDVFTLKVDKVSTNKSEVFTSTY